MGNDQVSRKRVMMTLELEELRLIRAALRFAQVSGVRPLSYDQDISASALVERMSQAILNSN